MKMFKAFCAILGAAFVAVLIVVLLYSASEMDKEMRNLRGKCRQYAEVPLSDVPASCASLFMPNGIGL